MKKTPALVFVTLLLFGGLTAQAQSQLPKNWLSGGVNLSLFSSEQNRGYSSWLFASYNRFLNEKQALGLSFVAQLDQTTFQNEVNSNQIFSIGLNYLRLYAINERWNWGLNHEINHNKRATNANLSAQLWYRLNKRWMLGSELRLLQMQYSQIQKSFQLSTGLNLQGNSPIISVAYTF